ncbi:hypothetical protein BH23PAT2_BH23PAT2_02070 [soil metagenome]
MVLFIQMKHPSQQPAKSESQRFHTITTSSYQPDKSGSELANKSNATVWKRLVIYIFAILLFVFICFMAWNIKNVADASKSLFGSSNVLGYIPTSPLPADTNNRVTILIVGYSIDRLDGGGASLTDSILIMSIDKASKKSYMLSIPRDLYISIPGYGYAKINEAYQIGERQDFQRVGYSDGGLGLLEKTIEDSFGIQTHFNALVNYSSVREIVDALGGITVAIRSPDERGLYDPNFRPHEGGPLNLKNGRQVIDGQTALRLTRARGSAGGYGFPQSDFNRTENQQIVLAAITRELQIYDLINPLANARIFNAIGDNVSTDVAMSEAIPLFRLLVSTSPETMESYTLRELDGENYLASYRTPDGLSALIPALGVDDYSGIQKALQAISSPYSNPNTKR